ncbi:MAG TPA: glycerol-3-phosphate 1-O-acyltransferase PlsY [Bacteroidota bacterium]|jgi:glycerol-3-phosphate acyltransferase PlsY|nr:glycerol-3-phosphate 1-O-acyltransferase PlsY [Bacteroidota bacterium]
MYSLIFIILLSYLIGSIPFGLIVGKIAKGIDIRKYGSGNIGSTNVSRILGFKYGLMTQIGDILKGVVPTLIIAPIFYSKSPFQDYIPINDYTFIQILAGIAAVCGHIWTIFAGFRGGKGVNTAVGILIGLAPIDLLISFGIFLLVLIISGYVSLGSIIAAISFPTIMFIRENIFKVSITGYSTLIVFAIILSLIIIFTHRSNIDRLLAKKENRFNKLMIKNWTKKQQ